MSNSLRLLARISLGDIDPNDDKLYWHHYSPGAETTWFPLASVGIDPKAKRESRWVFRAFSQGKIRALGRIVVVRIAGVIAACVFRRVVHHMNHFSSLLGISNNFMIGDGYIYLIQKPRMSSCPEHVICHSVDCCKAKQIM